MFFFSISDMDLGEQDRQELLGKILTERIVEIEKISTK